MDWLRQFRFKLRALWRRRALESDMAEEMREHLGRLTSAAREAGMSEVDARGFALRQFGNVSSLRERARDERCFRPLEGLVQDLRYATRQLLRSPTFATTAILSLALGIGANTAIFSAIDAILLRELPLPDAERLAVVQKGPVDGVPTGGIAPGIALELVSQVQPFGTAAPFTLTQFVIRQGDSAERVSGMRVASTFFGTLAVTPALGRDFLPSDDRVEAERVAIISNALWQRQFGRNPDVLGRRVAVENGHAIIIGVMPESFRFPALFGTSINPEVWTPLAFPHQEAADRGAGYMFVLLKRRAEWSWAAVQRELTVIARAYGQLEPLTFGKQDLKAIPAREQVAGKLRPMLLLLWGTVSCVLLIACTNTVNVVLSRTASRSRELALRVSLGASRARLLSQLFTESVLLAVVAAAIGLLIAAIAMTTVRQTLSEFLPRADEIAIDWRVLMFTIATASACSLAVGLLPARRAAMLLPRDAMNASGTRASTEGRWAAGLRKTLLVGQIAVAVLLGITAVLLGRTFVAVLGTDLGFRPDALLTFELPDPNRDVPRQQLPMIYEQLSASLRSLPGVTSVGALSFLPLSGADFGWVFLTQDRPALAGTALPAADVRIVTPGTLETLGVPIRRGRFFQQSDRPDGLPVTVVNETFARHVWPGEDPIGKKLKLAGPLAVLPWMTVVGVAADVRFDSPDRPARPMIYRPHAQHPWKSMAIVLRTAGAPADVVPGIRAEVKSLWGNGGIFAVREFTFYFSRSLAERRLLTLLVWSFAGIALVLALVGVYGVFAYTVTSRTREIGVRLALGSAPARVIWMMMRQALALGSFGVAAGAFGVFAARRLIEPQLLQLRVMDAPTMAGVSITVLTTALVACYLPARRVTRIDPTTALRAE